MTKPIDRAAAAAELRAYADQVADGSEPVPAITVRTYDDGTATGGRLRVVPRVLHDVLCSWRIATPQEEVDSNILHCAGCGLAYLRPSVELAEPPDEETADILWRCRSALRNHGGHPNGAWSTGEQLAVALVLGDREHMQAMGYTPVEAARRVRGGMYNPPADMAAWVTDVRGRLDENGR